MPRLSLRRLLAIAAALLLPVPVRAQEPPAGPPPAIPAREPEGPTRVSRDESMYEISRIERDGMVTIYFRVGHERGRILKAILEGSTLQIPGRPVPEFSVTQGAKARILTDRGYVGESEELHLLIISDAKENVPHIEAVLRILDLADPQVEIHGEVYEFRWDKDLQIGVEGEGPLASLWTLRAGSEAFFKEVRVRFNPTEAITGGPFQGATFRFGRTSAHQGTIGALIQAFAQRGRARILSRPYVTIRSGQEAFVTAGERIPFSETVIHPGGSTTTVKYEPTGVTLKVRPHIIGSSQVNLLIDCEVKALQGFLNLPTGTAPAFTTRQAKTEVTVRDDEEIVIGGLILKEETEVRRGLPFLSDLPIFGILFGRYEEIESVREIIFRLRPIILRGQRRVLVWPETK